MSFKVKRTKQFRNDMKRMLKRGKDIELLLAIVDKLARDEAMPETNRDHALTGNYIGLRECHIEPNCLYTDANRLAQRPVLAPYPSDFQRQANLLIDCI